MRFRHQTRWTVAAAAAFVLADQLTLPRDMGGGMVLAMLLFWRADRGGRTSRSILLFLTTAAAVLGAMIKTMILVAPNEGTSTNATWPAIVMFAVSAWCLAAPAFQEAEVDRRMREFESEFAAPVRD